MKILLFTHKSDIDGMGNAVLAKLAFDEVDYVLCETFNLQNEIAKYYDDGSIYNYDKFFVFDHHKSALEGNFNKYPFTTIRISDERGLCSGTSLFYEYLVANSFIDSTIRRIEDFSELTRKYDTWEWKTKYNDEMPHELTLLFDSVGCDGYIKLMFEKLRNSANGDFQFSELERMLIDNKISQVQEKLSNYAKKIYYREILGLKAGIVFIDY